MVRGSVAEKCSIARVGEKLSAKCCNPLAPQQKSKQFPNVIQCGFAGCSKYLWHFNVEHHIAETHTGQSADWAKPIFAEQKTFNTTAQANLLIAQQVKSRKRNRQKDDVADGGANKKIKLESGAAIAGTIKTEPTESEVVVKTEVEDVAKPRLAAKMMLGVLGIKT